jgi:acyl-lipid omega-6 desaturase (Delta-12 desaturase)
MTARNDDRALIDATRPFTQEQKGKSVFAALSTLLLLAGSIAIAAMPRAGGVGIALRTCASVFAGLLIVRTFILFHDFQHGAILRNSKLWRTVFAIFGGLILVPAKVWRETHNYHHANNAKIVGSHVGSYLMVTTTMWAEMSPKQRFSYKAIRHPLTIACAYFTIFAWGMCVSPFLRGPKKHWAAPVCLAVHVALIAVVSHRYGFSTAAFAIMLPMAIATAAGGYLFYAQHNFPDVVVMPREKWSFAKAALDSSSFMEMGPLMRFFCGNIGFHHVHHLNAQIPFYRLPEAMAAIPELQAPHKTSLRPRDVVACFRLKLWDQEQGRMVSYQEAERTRPSAVVAA